jgi:hypothetical protein
MYLIAAWMALSIVALIAVAFLNRLGHDATEGLPPRLRKSVTEALKSAAGCSMANARIASITAVSEETDLDSQFHFRCEWTLLGWPSMSGTAQCVDGSWVVPGWRDSQHTLTKCGVPLR